MRAPYRVLLSSLAAIAAVALPLASFDHGRAAAAPDDGPSIVLLTSSQLDELVAPVALYPDVVLDSLLPATAAPGDVAAAAQFVVSSGGPVTAAPQGVAWEPSVVAMLQFPDVVRWMGDNPAWVEQMGFAVTMQQPDVLAAIQRFRARARALGALSTNEYTSVVVRSPNVIVIEPVTPHYVYVPVYDPFLLDSFTIGGSFYNSWLSFSFGTQGYWGYNRIYWGSGIYAYNEPWWGYRWRNAAYDWGTARPYAWRPAYRTDQTWRRRSWAAPATIARPASPRYRTRDAAAPAPVYVAPPTRTTTTESAPTNTAPTNTAPTNTAPTRTAPRNAPRWQQPKDPAAPITPWRSRTTPAPTQAPTEKPVLPTAPKTPTPRAVPTAPRVLPTPTPKATPFPRAVPTAPGIDRKSVDWWSRRGNGSLDGGAKVTPKTVPVTPTPPARPVVPARPRVVVPQQPRFFFPPPAQKPDLDGTRTKDKDERGKKSLGS